MTKMRQNQLCGQYMQLKHKLKWPYYTCSLKTGRKET